MEVFADIPLILINISDSNLNKFLEISYSDKQIHHTHSSM